MLRSPIRGGVTALAALTLALAGASQASAATYTVNSTVDQTDQTINGVCAALFDSGCTLRAAIDEANASPEADTVVLPAGTYRLDRSGEGVASGENRNALGDLDVAAESKLTIQGDGAETTAISGNGIDRVLDVGPLATFKLQGVTLRDGDFFGGQDEGWQKEEVVIDKLPTAVTPAGLAADLPKGVSLDGIPCICTPLDGGGGLRVNRGADVTLEDSVVSHNVADNLGSGGGLMNARGDLTLIRTRVHRNVATLFGGGVYNLGILTVEDSTLDENATILAGGGLANFGSFDIDGSTINGNLSALQGGGVFTVGVPAPSALAASVVFEVAAPNAITNSTLTDNAVRFGQGGAVYTAGDALDLASDTIADNDVSNFDLFQQLSGGPGLLLEGPSAPVARGAAVFSADGPFGISDVAFTNTIVSNGIDRGTPDNCATDAVEALPFVSHGNNIESDDAFKATPGTCSFNQESDQTDVDPKLATLRDNGGPTETRALLTGSAALQKGGQCAAVDQRGGHRPPAAGSAGEACDVGAYEANSLADLSVDSYTDAPDAATVGKPLHYNAVVRNAGPDMIKGVKLAVVLPAGATVDAKPAACTGDGPVTCDLGELAKGDVATIPLIVRPASTGGVTSTATVSAPGMTDTNAANDSASTQTQVDAAPVQQQQQLTPPQTVPQQQKPQDKSVELNIDVPKTATLDDFFAGITVEADCGDEACLRKFREHAAINTGATHIAGFNLTVSRTSLGFKAKGNKVKLKPCLSGSKTGKAHKRCLRNLRQAATKALPFKVKVVVAAVDKAGNHTAAKATIKITG
jgi:CSLREA domain-containing protein/uncharacterized repeat protein (TIGR01451 family)